MLSEGVAAPAVDLPGYVDGERTRVDLDEYIGDGIVVLTFYPSDFNPGCSMQESDLGDLDLFTMQKDVTVFGISPDSTYSHEAFAERYSLKIPLLSDVDGEAAGAYDVAMETDVGEELSERAVFVVDHRGIVQYAWATDDLEERVDVDPVKRAVGDIGGDETALERYRVGYEHYVAGRDAFSEAMAEYEEREWIPARGGFADAEPAFTAAADHFDTAVRFAETADFEAVVDRAEEKADTLQHAASWLADSADALASGRGKQGKGYREDAERLLDAASDLPDPPDGEAFTLLDDGIDLDDAIVVDPEREDDADPRRAGDAVDADLGVGDAALDAAADEEGPVYDDDREGDAVEGDLEVDLGDVAESDADGGERAESIEGDTVEGDLEMDLDAIDGAGEADGDGPVDTTGATDSDGEPASNDGPTSDDGPAVDEGPERPVPRKTAPASPDERSVAGPGAASESATDGDAEGTGDGGSADDAGDGEDTDDGDESADVAELDLADPTEADDEADDDERADWDIPGR